MTFYNNMSFFKGMYTVQEDIFNYFDLKIQMNAPQFLYSSLKLALLNVFMSFFWNILIFV